MRPWPVDFCEAKVAANEVNCLSQDRASDDDDEDEEEVKGKEGEGKGGGEVGIWERGGLRKLHHTAECARSVGGN